MATSASFKKQLTCSVCLELYTDPHQLKCLHTYCLGCIQDMKRSNLIQCPECRKNTSLTDIQKDFKISSLVDIYTKEEQDVNRLSIGGGATGSRVAKSAGKCEMCENADKEVVCKCVDCDQFMCATCDKTHKGIKMLKYHQVISIADMIKSLKKESKDKQREMDDMQVFIDKKCLDISEIVRNVKMSQHRQISELHKYKQDMVQKIDKHVKHVEHLLKTSNKQLLQSLSVSQRLCEQMKRKMKSTTRFLGEISGSDDIGTLSDTMQNLDSDVKRQIEELRSRLNEIDVSVQSSAVIHKKEFDPEKYVSLSAENTGITLGSLPSKLDYTELCDKRIDKIKSVNIPGWYSAQRIKLINDKIWCAMGDGGLNIYNKDCDLATSVSHDKLRYCCGIAKTYTGDVIVACYDNCGLHRLSSSGNYQRCIAQGSFSDVCSYNDTLYVLDYDSCHILMLNCNQGRWSCARQVMLQYENGHFWDKLCVNTTGIYVSSNNNNCLYEYNLDGDFVYKSGRKGSGEAGLFQYPRICDVDYSGNILLCDYMNHQLQIYNQDKREWGLLSVQGELEKPFDAVVDIDGKYIWVVTVGKELIKFSIGNQ